MYHRVQIDRRCTFVVALRRARVSLAAVKKQYYIFWGCLCSLCYQTCKAHAPSYIVICDLSGTTIILHIIS